MELSSPRFKAISVTLGLSLWFFIITSALGFFSIRLLIIFFVGLFITTQILAVKLSRVLDAFAVLNTKIFLGILYVPVISLYGILFKILRIDLLRLKKQNMSYWLEMEQLTKSRIVKQY